MWWCAEWTARGADGSTPMAIGCFAAMGGTRVNEPSRMVFALDHNAPAPSRAATQLHQRMREFVAAPEPERQAIARPES